MFGFKKKADKEFEFKVSLIQEIGTLQTQNKFLWDELKKLKNKVVDLEATINGTVH
jgi:hypothetical protein